MGSSADPPVAVRQNSVAVLGFHDGSAGQVETWLEEVAGLHIACFVHESDEPLVVDPVVENARRASQLTEYPTRTGFKGRPLIVATDWLERLQRAGIRRVLPLTPDNRLRLRQIARCRDAGMELVSAIHPTATVMDGARIDPGVWINARAFIGYKAEIKTGVIVNTGAQLDHHNVLRRGCQVAPGVVTAGFVALGECCYVHTGAIVILRREVGADAIIGAGAVVTKDIPPRCTAVGVPARVIKYHDA